MAISGRSVACLLVISALVLVASPAAAQTCGSGELSSDFENCTDLPTLRASLHWTYRTSPNPSLSIAFTAPPAAPRGWVAWGLNPTAARMVGTQALLAFPLSNGSLVVDTHNLSSTSPDLTSPSPISYNVLNRRATISGGRITIFANLSLPAPIRAINQSWQVGQVLNGVPQPHAFAPENFASVGELNLVSSSGAPSPSTSPSPSPLVPPPSPSPSPSPSSSPSPSTSPSPSPSSITPPPSSPPSSPRSSPTPPSPSGLLTPPSPSGATENLAKWAWVCAVTLGAYLFEF